MMKRLSIICIIAFLLNACKTSLTWMETLDIVVKNRELLLKKNGNVFEVSSTYSNYLAIWSYGDDGMMEIDTFVLHRNGMLKSRCLFVYRPFPAIKGAIINDANLKREVKLIPVVLDGDGILYQIEYNGNLIEGDMMVDISEFKARNFDNEILKEIQRVIIEYNLWDFNEINHITKVGEIQDNPDHPVVDPGIVPETERVQSWREYCGSHIYLNGSLERVLTPAGCIDSLGVHHAYVRDYRGSVRADDRVGRQDKP